MNSSASVLKPRPRTVAERDELDDLLQYATTLLQHGSRDESIQILEGMIDQPDLSPWFVARAHAQLADAYVNLSVKLHHITTADIMADILMKRNYPARSRPPMRLERFATTTRRTLNRVRKTMLDRETDAHAAADACGCCQRLLFDSPVDLDNHGVSGEEHGAIAPQAHGENDNASSRAHALEDGPKGFNATYNAISHPDAEKAGDASLV